MKEFQPIALVILTAVGVALIALANTTGVAAFGGALVGIAFSAAARMGGEIQRKDDE